MPRDEFRYPTIGLGPALLIPWLGLVTAVALAFLLFGNPNFLVPSTRPAGYFGLILAGATTIWFFRYNWHRRFHFLISEDGLTVVTPRGHRELVAWKSLATATYYTNTGLLTLARREGASAVVIYPTFLDRGAELVAEIDARSQLNLAGIADLTLALERAV